MVASPAASPSVQAILFHGLADPSRLSCLLAVRESSKTVGEIVATTRLSQPNVSKHLACLRDCGLVDAERDGRYMRYNVADPAVVRLLEASEELIARVGDAVAACPTYGRRRQL
jgi:ArsR family transcriptional regulator, cadmium/lead-responsive transcriptional repressor